MADFTAKQRENGAFVESTIEHQIETSIGRLAQRFMEYFQALLQRILDENPDDRLILGIDGLSRSGKTTLSRRAEESLKGQGI